MYCKHKDLLRKAHLQAYLNCAMDDGVYPIFYIGLRSGLRQSELISLPWAAVNLSEKVIYGQHRDYPLTTEACELLTAEKEDHPESRTVFLLFHLGEAEGLIQASYHIILGCRIVPAFEFLQTSF